ATEVDCEDVPPGPVQLSTKLVEAVRAALVVVPLVGSLLALPHAPEGVLEGGHAVAFCVLQMRCTVPPGATELASDGSRMLGTGGAGATLSAYVPASALPVGCATTLIR